MEPFSPSLDLRGEDADNQAHSSSSGAGPAAPAAPAGSQGGAEGRHGAQGRDEGTGARGALTCRALPI